jgi:hypothetical protein
MMSKGEAFFHLLGLSCIGGAIFIQVLAFSSIAIQGYFTGFEPNPYILTIEICMTIFAVIYFFYIVYFFVVVRGTTY